MLSGFSCSAVRRTRRWVIFAPAMVENLRDLSGVSPSMLNINCWLNQTSYMVYCAGTYSLLQKRIVEKGTVSDPIRSFVPNFGTARRESSHVFHAVRDGAANLT